MKRAATVLFLLGCFATARAQPVQNPEVVAAKLLRCSILYLAISDIRGEQPQGRGPSPFLSQGMTYRGMALALTTSEFVSSQLKMIEKTIGSRSVADAVALLNDAETECMELPLAHAQSIAEAFERTKAKKGAGAHTK